MNLTRRLTLALMPLALFSAAGASVAQDYPNRPISWIVPFSAGGPTDSMARDIADKVSRELKQPIIIENLGGAGGTLGAGKAARAKPDGYTLLVGHMGYMGAAPALYKKLSYDPVGDFAPVFRFPDTPLVLLVNANSPHRSAGDLIAAAKKEPGKLNFGHAGVGSTSHLIAALFAGQAGIDIVLVPYKGAAPAMQDLIGGQMDAMFDQSNTALPQVEGGRLKAIALTSLQPMDKQYPGVRPLADGALSGFEAATWYGLYAPKGTPQAVIDRLHQAYLKAMGDASWQKQMSDRGIQLLSQEQYSPPAFGKHTADEVARWRKVAADAKIQLD
jgi:tripartite-type tricarboxylate transporter receptor subunit TctC